MPKIAEEQSRSGESGQVSPADKVTGTMEMRRYFLESKQVFTWDQTTVDTITTRDFTADDGSRKREESHVIEKNTLFTRDYSFKFGGIELLAHFEKDKSKYIDNFGQDREEDEHVVVPSATPTLQLGDDEEEQATLQEQQMLKPPEPEPPQKPTPQEVDQIDNTIIVDATYPKTELDLTHPPGVSLTDKVLQKPPTPISNGEILPVDIQSNKQDDGTPDEDTKPEVGKQDAQPIDGSTSTDQSTSEVFITPQGTPTEILSPDEEQVGLKLEEKRLIRPPSQSSDDKPERPDEPSAFGQNKPESPKRNGVSVQDVVFQTDLETATTEETRKAPGGAQEPKEEQVSPVGPQALIALDEPRDIQTAIMPSETLQKPEDRNLDDREPEPKDKKFMLKDMVESAFDTIEIEETRTPPKPGESHGQEPREDLISPDKSTETMDLDTLVPQTATLSVETLEKPVTEEVKTPEEEPKDIINSDVDIDKIVKKEIPPKTDTIYEQEPMEELAGPDEPKQTIVLKDDEIVESATVPEKVLQSPVVQISEENPPTQKIPVETLEKPVAEEMDKTPEEEDPKPKDIIELDVKANGTDEKQIPSKTDAIYEQEPIEELAGPDQPKQTMILKDDEIVESATVPEKVLQSPVVQTSEESLPTQTAPAEEDEVKPLDERAIEGTPLSSQEPSEDVVFSPDTVTVPLDDEVNIPEATTTAKLDEELLEPPPLPKKTRKSQELDERIVTVMEDKPVLDLDTNQNETMAIPGQVLQAPPPPSQEPEVGEIKRPEVDATVDVESSHPQTTSMSVSEETLEGPSVTALTKRKETTVTVTETTLVEQEEDITPSELRKMVESAFDIVDESEAQENVTDVPLEVEDLPTQEIPEDVSNVRSQETIQRYVEPTHVDEQHVQPANDITPTTEDEKQIQAQEAMVAATEVQVIQQDVSLTGEEEEPSQHESLLREMVLAAMEIKDGEPVPDTAEEEEENEEPLDVYHTQDTAVPSKFVFLPETLFKFIPWTTFRVRSESEVYVALTKTLEDVENDAHVITLGALDNTLTTIQDGSKGPVVNACKTDNILSEKYFRSFWISWDNHKLQIGKGRRRGYRTIMEYDIPENRRFPIKYVAVGTGEKPSEWEFFLTPELKAMIQDTIGVERLDSFEEQIPGEEKMAPPQEELTTEPLPGRQMGLVEQSITEGADDETLGLVEPRIANFRTLTVFHVGEYRFIDGYPLDDCQWVVFGLQAASDVRVILTSEYDELSQRCYEVIIGGDNNSKTEIMASGEKQDEWKTQSILSKDMYKTFCLSWNEDKIELAEGVEGKYRSVLEWNIPGGKKHTIKYLAICGTGVWKIPEYTSKPPKDFQKRATYLVSKALELEPQEPSYTEVTEQRVRLGVLLAQQEELETVTPMKLEPKIENLQSFTISQETDIRFIDTHPVHQQRWFVFGVRAANDVRVYLSSAAGETKENCYTVQLGCEGNTKTQVVVSGVSQIEVPTHGILSDVVFKTFWVKWDDDKLEVGEGDRDDQRSILEWTIPDDKRFPVNAIALSIGATPAEFRVPEFNAVSELPKATQLLYMVLEMEPEKTAEEAIVKMTEPELETVQQQEEQTPFEELVALEPKIDHFSCLTIFQVDATRVLEGYPLPGQRWFVFGLRGSSDARVALLNVEENVARKSYEVVLGSEGNTKTEVKEHGVTQMVIPTENILSKDVFKTFWINWEDDKLTLGENDEGKQKTKLEWEIPKEKRHPVNAVAVCCGDEKGATWMVPNFEVTTLPNDVNKVSHVTYMTLQAGCADTPIVDVTDRNIFQDLQFVEEQKELEPTAEEISGEPKIENFRCLTVFQVDDYRFLDGWPLPEQQWVVFGLKSAKDARVVLATVEGSQARKSYEIVIGGNENSTTEIMAEGQIQKTTPTESILSKDIFKTFWISWCNDKITLGESEKDVHRTMLEWDIPEDKRHDIDAIAVSSRCESGAVWMLPEFQVMKQPVDITKQSCLTYQSLQLEPSEMPPVVDVTDKVVHKDIQLVVEQKEEMPEEEAAPLEPQIEKFRCLTVLHVDDYRFLDEWPLPEQQWIVFGLKSAKDARVVLATVEGSQARKSYEVVIGGNENSTTEIMVDGETQQTIPTKSILSKDIFKTFWISWCNDKITLGESDKDAQRTVLEWDIPDDKRHDIDAIAVSSRCESGAVWMLPEFQVMKQPFDINKQSCLTYQSLQLEPSEMPPMVDVTDKVVHKDIQLVVEKKETVPAEQTIPVEPKIEKFRCLTVLTVDDYRFLELPLQQWLVFGLKAAQDARVCLGTEEGNKALMNYEIVIGGNNNTTTEIRESGKVRKSEKTESILSKDIFKTFWISWNDDRITVGANEEDKQQTVLEWDIPEKKRRHISAVAVAAGDKHGAVWMVPEFEETTEPVDIKKQSCMTFQSLHLEHDAPPIVDVTNIAVHKDIQLVTDYTVEEPEDEEESEVAVEPKIDLFRCLTIFQVDDYRFLEGWPLPEHQWVVFGLKSSKDARIVLATVEENQAHKSYEIIIGGDENTTSEIKESEERQIIRPTKSILNKDVFKTFWISWSDDKLILGEGDQDTQRVVLEWDIPADKRHRVDAIAVSSGDENGAVWMIPEFQSAVPLCDVKRCSCLTYMSLTLETEKPTIFDVTDKVVHVDIQLISKKKPEPLKERIVYVEPKIKKFRCMYTRYVDDYKFLVNQPSLQHQWVIFGVRAAENARVCLTSVYGDAKQKCYEIILGGEGNTKTEIRESGKTQKEVMTKSILSKDIFKTYWISWENDTIQVGEGDTGTQESILEWKIPADKRHTVKHVALASGGDSKAEWKIPEFTEESVSHVKPQTLAQTSLVTFQTLQLEEDKIPAQEVAEHISIQEIHLTQREKVEKQLNEVAKVEPKIESYSVVTTLPVDDYRTIPGCQNVEWMVFGVRAKDNARVCLTSVHGDTKQKSYEVVIGSHSNSKTEIQESGETVVEAPTEAILSQDLMKPFWMSWDDAKIKVGEGVTKDEQTVLEWEIPESKLQSVDEVSVFVDSEEGGEWMVPMFAVEQELVTPAVTTSEVEETSVQLAEQTIEQKEQTTVTVTEPRIETFVTMRTHKADDYQFIEGYPTETLQSIVFGIRAAGNARVALTSKTGDVQHGVYEVVIGGADNTKSEIREGGETQQTVETENILSKDMFKPYWISWDEAKIQMGQGQEVKKDVVVEWAIPEDKIHPVNAVAVAVDDKDGGSWRLPDFAEPKETPEKETEVVTYDESVRFKEALNFMINNKEPKPENVETFVTNPDDDYYFFEETTVVEKKWVIFNVKSKGELHVVLSSVSGLDKNRKYEIILGCDANNKSKILENGEEKVETDTHDIISDTEYHVFWITWTDQKLRVGRGKFEGFDLLMELPIPDENYEIISAAVLSTDTAEWQVLKVTGDVTDSTETTTVEQTTDEQRYHITPEGLKVPIETSRKVSESGEEEKPYFETIISAKSEPDGEYETFEEWTETFEEWTEWTVFRVKTDQEAKVALSGSSETGGSELRKDAYEIILGADNNKKTYIKQNDRIEAEVSSKGILSSDNFRTFWLSWEDAKVQIGRGYKKGNDKILEWEPPKESWQKITNLGVSSGVTGAEWEFLKYKGWRQTAGDEYLFDQDYPSESESEGGLDLIENFITVLTPAVYDYQYLPEVPVTDKTWITFRLRAGCNGNIALSSIYGETDSKTYEIQLGGRDNNRSMIRHGGHGAIYAETYTRGVLNPQEFRPFWISWDGGKIRVGRGNKKYKRSFLEWTIPEEKMHSVNCLAVATGEGSDGQWEFVEYIDPNKEETKEDRMKQARVSLLWMSKKQRMLNILEDAYPNPLDTKDLLR
ncbi:uncharacterized protein LOC106167937 isoform X1 [Lingula anatina]|uniref:Uncharacterized protein LOC106167937 isoform X1 n=1 Tax=Lingula anatina TaxID=7574 RepID=A0A1S3IXM0_LINAN|nr:uncharacterized protein LOC106167937 isoform X1 [Lingula anatina]XP_023932897.1 uncharacterized protein LOC106167937 isoform X2 [Lingula anatina]XP_023932898.1 uncharacterized protein LOC106167937 isoform X1 [Lingula anatina]|eukprot:XP_013402294.1 uncharacterized protein LOC106167937 isoform X1 [Lingula anatina]